MNPDAESEAPYRKISGDHIQFSPKKEMITVTDKDNKSVTQNAYKSTLSTNPTNGSKNQNHASLFKSMGHEHASKFTLKKKCFVLATTMISCFAIATLIYGGILYNYIFSYLVGVNLTINLLAYLFTISTLRYFERDSKAKHSFGNFRLEVLLSLLYDIFKLAMACGFGYAVTKNLVHVLKGNNHTTIEFQGSMIYAIGVFGFMTSLVIGYMLLMMEDVHIAQYQIQVAHKPDFEERVYNLRSTMKSKGPGIEEISENRTFLSDVPNLRRASNRSQKKIQTKSKRGLRMKIGLVRYLCSLAIGVLFLADSILLMLLPEHNLFSPILTLSSLIFVLVESFTNFRSSIPVLMEAVPQNFDTGALLAELKGIYSVEDVHDFHVWSLTYEKVYLTAHVDIKDLGEGVRTVVIEEMKDLFREYGISYCTLQIETEQNKDEYSSTYINCCNNLHPENM